VHFVSEIIECIVVNLFFFLEHSDWFQGLPSLSGYRELLGIQRPGHDANHLPSSNAELKDALRFYIVVSLQMHYIHV